MEPAVRHRAADALGLESPWLHRQVEGHLVFGFFARRLALGRALGVLLVLGLVTGFAEAALAGSWLVLLGRAVSGALLLLLFWPLSRMSRYRQAAIGWWSVKIAIGLCSFVMFFVGGVIGFVRGQPDAIHLTLLALIWAPSVEFIPSLVAYQRVISVGRMLVSVPVVILGSRAGAWTWH